MSDTHIGGRRSGRVLPPALRRACEQADLILHGGDVTAPAVLDELEGYAPVQAVLGNVDGWDLAERLPEQRVVDLGVLRLGMVHDPGPERGRAARLAGRFPGCAIVVFGHTHLPECRTDGGVLLLNPGSPTERRRAPMHSYALLDVAADGSFDARLVPLEG